MTTSQTSIEDVPLTRRVIFYVGPILFLLCSLGQFRGESALIIFIMRFLLGVAVGIEYPAATSLLVPFQAGQAPVF